MTKQDLLKTTLKNRKQRMTAQRELILRVFMESNGKLLSADDVFMEIRKKRNHRTNKMTVKRSIDLLVELGMLKEINFENDIPKYEYLKNRQIKENAVFVCESCHSAEAFEISTKDLEQLLHNYISDIEVKEVSIKITGYCAKCKKELSDSTEEINEENVK
ncbi:MAG: transcriptional repressor [Arcobacter sp.]|nr:transcriptional repressor [Arcobacter sp.]